MKYTISKLVAAFITLLVVSQVSLAVPAFARQMSMQCSGCHFQSYPALNAFGRSFRSGGYVLNSRETIEGEGLSLPKNLGMSFIAKIRYHLKETDISSRGEIQWPDEAAILMGGRAGKDIGFLFEIGQGPQEVEIPAGTKTSTADTTGNFLSTKFHFNINDKFAVIPFSTDGLGVGYGFELFNTGAQRSQRPIENRKGLSAYQQLGTGSGGATGIALVYHTNNIFVNYSKWSPTFANVKTKASELSNYLRIGYTLNISGWDTGIGVTIMNGETITADDEGALTTHETKSRGIDLQIQKNIDDISVGLYSSYVTVPANTLYNEHVQDAKAFSLTGKFGFKKNKFQPFLSYISYDNNATGTKYNDTTAGLQYMVAQNAKIEFTNVSSSKPDAAYKQLMLFVGF